MNMTVLMIATYYLGGAAAAAWMFAKGHVDSRLAFLVLPLLYLAHLLFCKAVAGRGGNLQSEPKSPKHACLACGNHIGMLGRLAGRHCCSPEHEQLHLAKLRELAIERLKSSFGVTSSLNPPPTRAVHEARQSIDANCTLALPHHVPGA